MWVLPSCFRSAGPRASSPRVPEWRCLAVALAGLVLAVVIGCTGGHGQGTSGGSGSGGASGGHPGVGGVTNTGGVDPGHVALGGAGADSIGVVGGSGNGGSSGH